MLHPGASHSRTAFLRLQELLTSSQISWKYYVTSGTIPDTEDGEAIGPPPAQQQIPKLYNYWNPLPAFPAVKNDPTQWNRLVDTAQFYADAMNGALPQVSWVIPSNPISEHPPSGVREGMAYVTGLSQRRYEWAAMGHDSHFCELGRLGRLLRSRLSATGRSVWIGNTNARSGDQPVRSPELHRSQDVFVRVLAQDCGGAVSGQFHDWAR